MNVIYDVTLLSSSTVDSHPQVPSEVLSFILIWTPDFFVTLNLVPVDRPRRTLVYSIFPYTTTIPKNDNNNNNNSKMN